MWQHRGVWRHTELTHACQHQGPAAQLELSGPSTLQGRARRVAGGVCAVHTRGSAIMIIFACAENLANPGAPWLLDCITAVQLCPAPGV